MVFFFCVCLKAMNSSYSSILITAATGFLRLYNSCGSSTEEATISDSFALASAIFHSFMVK